MDNPSSINFHLDEVVVGQKRFEIGPDRLSVAEPTLLSRSVEGQVLQFHASRSQRLFIGLRILYAFTDLDQKCRIRRNGSSWDLATARAPKIPAPYRRPFRGVLGEQRILEVDFERDPEAKLAEMRRLESRKGLRRLALVREIFFSWPSHHPSEFAAGQINTVQGRACAAAPTPQSNSHFLTEGISTHRCYICNTHYFANRSKRMVETTQSLVG